MGGTQSLFEAIPTQQHVSLLSVGFLKGRKGEDCENQGFDESRGTCKEFLSFEVMSEVVLIVPY